MKRRAAITAASAVTLAVLGGGIAVAAGSGLFGSPRDPGAGQLAPVLDPAAVSAPLDGTVAQPAVPEGTASSVPVSTQGPSSTPRAGAGAGTAGRDDDGHDGSAQLGDRDDEHGDEHGDEQGDEHGDEHGDDHGGAAKDDEAADHQYEGHDDDD
jgi:hypothetical protein